MFVCVLDSFSNFISSFPVFRCIHSDLNTSYEESRSKHEDLHNYLFKKQKLICSRLSNFSFYGEKLTLCKRWDKNVILWDTNLFSLKFQLRGEMARLWTLKNSLKKRHGVLVTMAKLMCVFQKFLDDLDGWGKSRLYFSKLWHSFPSSSCH